MSDRVCLIHYHELGLKGHNRSKFERRLYDNVEASLVGYPASLARVPGHILAIVSDASRIDEIAAIIARCPGIVKVSIGWRCEAELSEMERIAAVALEDNDGYDSFKVAAKRSNTDFPIDSMELNKVIGAYLCEVAPDKKVLMKDPDVTVHVNVIQARTFIWSQSIPGTGGLPVGTAGKVVSLLSAGIDSPVSTWRMVNRGAVVICVHFSGRPQTDDSSEYLARQIIETLAPYGGIGRLYVVPFGDYQREISLACPPKLRVIIYRRLMFAVAQRIAHIEGAKALVTGESLGQVASQTLSNIVATDDAVDMPVFRPLIGNDKTEIIERAEKLGTFDISIQNHSDCCTLFMPRRPETHAKLDEVRAAWDLIDHDAWIDQITANLEFIDFDCPAYIPPREFRKTVE